MEHKTDYIYDEKGNLIYKFETAVQYMKYKVLREVARQAWKGTLLDNIMQIPQIIIP